MSLLTNEADILKAWEIYQINVHPIVNILHPETFEELLRAAISRQQSRVVPPMIQCAVLAMVLAAVTSLDDGECEKELHHARPTMIVVYTNAILVTLQEANFKTTDELLVLQALTLYSVSIYQILIS